MLLRRIYDGALAQAAYLVGCDRTKTAVLIDPACDIDRYLAIAAAEGLRIVAVAETHVHADFVSGVRAFVTHHPVTAYMSAEGPVQPWEREARFATGASIVRLASGDSFSVGDLCFTARHTPGHTRESLCFELAREGSTPIIFSGDFLFAGDVGRPDLGAFATDGMSVTEAVERLRLSLSTLDDLPAGTQVLPGHGAGSECGRAICNLPATTLAIERVINRALRAHADGAGFHATVMEGSSEPPPYFSRVKRLNESGAFAHGAISAPQALSAEEFARLADREQTVVIDTRPWIDFIDLRLPRSISAPLERSFGPTVANYIEEGDAVVLVANAKDAEAASRILARVGIAPEQIAGYLSPDAVARLPISCFSSHGVDDISPVAVHAMVGRGDATVLDVRTCAEFARGHLPGAVHIPFTHLAARMREVPRDRPVVCYCRSGNRSARAAAFLARHGLTALNMKGGYWPYAGRGFAVEC